MQTITGYSDTWQVRPGDSLCFYVSSAEERYQADLVRLRHGDRNPNGPGLRQELLVASFSGTHAGREQSLPMGSCMVVENTSPLEAHHQLTIDLWIWPTLPDAQTQGVAGHWDDGAECGWRLLLQDGRVAWQVGAEPGRMVELRSDAPLVARRWYRVTAMVDAEQRKAELRVVPQKPAYGESPLQCVQADLAVAWRVAVGCPLVFGAANVAGAVGRRRAVASLNGKLARPVLRTSAPSIARDPVGEAPGAGNDLLGHWNFSQQLDSIIVLDASGHGLDGQLLQRPTRAVTGPDFDGSVDCYRVAPEQFDAIHFHDDDLDDAAWDESFSFVVPDDLPSGVYAAWVRSATGEDYIPFVVSPPRDSATSDVAVVLPTVSYLAYTCYWPNLDALMPNSLAIFPLRNLHTEENEVGYLRHHGLRSTYQVHRDGSGVCHATMRRPSFGVMRPSHRTRFASMPHGLSADLHLLDWLDAIQCRVDILTDHDLHFAGSAALERYRVVLTGTHCEYWTLEMLQAIEGYRDQGGRILYLSGNGLYATAALDSTGRTVEVRRTHGTWTHAPGEGYMSFNGRKGGLLAHLGHPAHRYVGVGMAALGYDRGSPYRRTPASYDARFQFVFDGVPDELIGDCPALALTYGAAGCELDSANLGKGTPRHAVVLASSVDFSDCYQQVEDIYIPGGPYAGGVTNPAVRSDMVYFDAPNGGAVFAVGSISWCSTLSYNDYDNTVARVTGNVLQAFRSGTHHFPAT